jgi:GNAT superfamily N-acetyltransferase
MLAMDVELRRLTETNFEDYCRLTKDEGDEGIWGCYCAFFHVPPAVWEEQCRMDPLLNREAVSEAVLAGRHVGVLAYEEGHPAAWVSVGPLNDFLWARPRVQALGADAPATAGILCFVVRPERRRSGMQGHLLVALADYATRQDWASLEGYPFDPAACHAHPHEKLGYPGFVKPFEEHGFRRMGPHWNSRLGFERWIYRRPLGRSLRS